MGHADLDLSTSAGRDTLARRIAAAAKQVCGTADGRDLRAMANRNRCLVEAQESATASAATVAAKSAPRRIAGL